MKNILAAAATAAALFATSQAQAITVNSNLLCSTSPIATTNSDTGGNANLIYLSVTDATLAGNAAKDCYGPVELANSSKETETDAFNAIFGASGAFSYLDRTNDSANVFSGLTFQVTAGSASSGSYTVSFTGGPLPQTFDFGVALKGAQNTAFYLFDSIMIATSPIGGSFDVQFKTPNGNNEPGLSHLTLFGRAASSPTTPVPEPASLALLGSGLLAFGMMRRRRA